MTAARILVLGATGRVGGAVLAALRDRRDIRVRAAGRRPEALEPRADETVRFDFDDLATYDAALTGVDRLFLLTGYSVDMLRHSKCLLDRAAAAGVAHVVHLGTHAPDDTPFSHHGWHQLIERYIEWRRFGFTHLRPAMFMNNIADYLRANRDHPGVLIHYTGDTPVAWIDTDDLGAAAATALTDPGAYQGRTCFLSAEALSMQGVAEILADVTGQPWRFEHRDAETLVPRLQAAGREMTYARSGVDFFRAVAAGDVPDVGRVDDTLQRMIGRPPLTWRAFAERHRQEFAY